MSILDHKTRLYCIDGSAYYYKTQTDGFVELTQCPAHPLSAVRDFVVERIEDNIPTCEGNTPSDLTIRTNVGDAIVDDDYVVTADPTNKKFIKLAIVRDDGTGGLEILAFEKLLGDYADIPSDKTLEKWLKEFSVVAAGTALVEEENFI